MDGSPAFTASYSGRLPDKAKLIKSLRVFPVLLSAEASWALSSNTLSYSLTCSDLVFGGRLAVDLESHKVEYSKCFRLLPFNLATVVAAAEWTLGGSITKPCLRLGVCALDGASSIVSGSGSNGRAAVSVALQTRRFLTRRWGVEACGSVAFTAPPRLQLVMERDRQRRSNWIEGSNLRADLQEVNVLLRF